MCAATVHQLGEERRHLHVRQAGLVTVTLRLSLSRRLPDLYNEHTDILSDQLFNNYPRIDRG